MEKHISVLVYRWSVFLLACFFVLYAAIYSDWGNAGGPLRYLTIWGLCLSFAVSFLVLRISRGISTQRWDALVATTAVINAMVVFLYWKLYFADPNSVTRNGELGVWWREYYMHALGPLLMWIDALFFNRVFKRLLVSMGVLVSVVIGYVAWIEVFVGPLNDAPVGSVTSGLPYPFLNNLEFAGRAVFYGTNVAVAVVFLLGFALAAFAIRKIFHRAEG